MNIPLYLKPSVQAEPLVDRWYAWPHLISPVTFARNITERHLKIMDSYVNAPQIHSNAVKSAGMKGGPFIDYGGKRVDEIRSLRDATKRDRHSLIQLSAAVADLDTLLRANAKGFSLAPLYVKVPEILRGYVELVYDIYNNPTFRIIEPLLYKSQYYDRSTQSLMLSFTEGDERPFVLSTPRLDEEGKVHLQIAFDSQYVDELFKLRNKPRPWEEISAMLNLDESKADCFQTFLTPKPPRKNEPYAGPGVRLRYLGHACILLETKGLSILTDPVLSYSYQTEIPRYVYEDLPDSIDYVLLTHSHQDHVSFETLLQIRSKIKNIVVPKNITGSLQDPSMKLMLQHCGFRNVIEIGDMESIDIGSAEIVGLPFWGEHAELDLKSKIAYLLRIAGRSFMFAADSCNLEPKLYEHIHKHVGNIDALFLGMECDGAPLTWVYGPLLAQRPERGMDESRRLNGSNYEQAIDVALQFNCREVYVYAMGQEPWLTHVMSLKYTSLSKPIVESDRLIEECRRRGIRSERLFGRNEIIYGQSI
jgi:L-ascorbate metabolism protein UlaG (beta-lactamase superfamily)